MQTATPENPGATAPAAGPSGAPIERRFEAVVNFAADAAGVGDCMLALNKRQAQATASSDPSHPPVAGPPCEETREEVREGTGEELGMEIYLKFFPDGAAGPLKQILRQAGLRVVPMPGAPGHFQEEDKHLQVTANYAKITDAAVDEFRGAVWSGIRSSGAPYGEGTSDFIERGELDEVRAEYPMLWAQRCLETDSGWSMREVEEALTRLAANGLIVDSGTRRGDGEIVWVDATRPWAIEQP
jgi:hypothetical protein